MKEKILIIEDDKAIVDIIRMILEEDGYEIHGAFNGISGIQKFKDIFPDIVLLDIKMPRMDGIEVLQELKKIDRQAIIIMISGHGNIETAVQTTKLGAYDFISKPFEVERLKVTIQNGLIYKNLLSENEYMKGMLGSEEKFIGNSEAMKKLRILINKVASTNSRVLITGENGTGKELVAKEIHRLSDRGNNPFIQVFCSTIPSEQIEVELFGCVEGYLQYSPAKRIGKFELAESGTIFLDEVADLTLDAQAKLLNVLSENQIEVLGSGEFKKIDVRVISSTNQNLEELISTGKFREDLYHRLKVLTINVPPLRERKEDIPELISHFSNQICKINNIIFKEFSKSAVKYLSSLNWNGNVRELRNTVEKLLILSDSKVIDKALLETGDEKFISELDKIINSSISLHKFQAVSEKIFIQKKLEENNWNISKTAEMLNIQRSHLYNKMKQLEIENPNKAIQE